MPRVKAFEDMPKDPTPPPAMPEEVKAVAPDPGDEIIAVAVINLVDKTVSGKNLDTLDFTYNAVKYHVILGSDKVNKIPRRVAEHLKTRKYPRYDIFKNEETGESFPAIVGWEPRFAVHLASDSLSTL